MATTTTPSWTDNVSVITDQVLAKGSTIRGTIDLRSKFSAMLFLAVGRGGTTAIGTALSVQVRRVLNNGTAPSRHPVGNIALSSTIAAASSTTVNVDAAAAAVELKLASISGLAVGDILCIQDSGAGVTRLEWARISKLTVASGTGVTLDAPLDYAHTSAQADTVRNKSDVFAPLVLEGGSLYEVIFDYGASATGESVTVRAIAQRLDSLSNA